MADVSCAEAAVNFYSQRSPVVRRHVVHVQFSSHDQLLHDDASAAPAASTQVARFTSHIVCSARFV